VPSAPGPVDRLRSAWYGFWFALSERTGRVRGPRAETPCGELGNLAPEARARVDSLRAHYAVAFERRYAARSALLNYEYLDLLDAASAEWGWEPPRGGEVHDVGCGGFAYAAALHRWFAPRRLVGIDVEGHRRLQGGVTRHERVLGHLQGLAGAEFVVADYREYAERADVLTAFFPFVTPGPVLGWRLPLGLLDPSTLFGAMRRNLRPGGLLLMVNHGAEEAAVAAREATAAGFALRGRVERERLGGEPPWPVVVSTWC
jgi:SAM-dependent methyltransferase